MAASSPWEAADPSPSCSSCVDVAPPEALTIWLSSSEDNEAPQPLLWLEAVRQWTLGSRPGTSLVPDAPGYVWSPSVIDALRALKRAPLSFDGSSAEECRSFPWLLSSWSVAGGALVASGDGDGAADSVLLRSTCRRLANLRLK